jgi:uncharacterized protein (DUF1778 family)
MQDEKQLAETINLRVPADLARAIREAAARDDRTVSSWIRSRLSPVAQAELNVRPEGGVQ